MNFVLQPQLASDLLKAIPLKAEHFESLYSIACDPLLWEQHPNKDRYKREVFEVFFKGAMQSGGAFLVMDAKTGKVIGSSRYYDFNPETNSVAIGYTFVARSCWGKGYNPELKKLMLGHAFQYVNNAIFHIGAYNIRSQKSIEKLGAKKIDEIEVEYYGETAKLNFIYRIEKEDWENNLAFLLA